jgi:hypothetical protein
MQAFMEFGRKPVKEGMVLEYVPSTKRSRYRYYTPLLPLITAKWLTGVLCVRVRCWVAHRYLFVFTDVIMLTEQKKARRADRAYKFLEDALLVGAQVAALPDTPCTFRCVLAC